MKLLVSCDMEGVSGVVDWEQVEPGNHEYERFRAIMTSDVNAAVRGAFDAGADEILVSDGHENGRNILIDELDPRVCLNCGSPSPLSIVQGAESGMDAALLIGYHARYGAPDALLSHTWSAVTRNLWLNDVLVGETGLCAAVCGHFGVPVIFISGDDKVCAEAMDLLGPIEAAVVKTSQGRNSGKCLPLAKAQELIYDTVVRAVERLKSADRPPVYRVSSPVKMIVELMEAGMMERVQKIHGAIRLDDTRLEYTAKDMLDAFSVFRECNTVGTG